MDQEEELVLGSFAIKVNSGDTLVIQHHGSKGDAGQEVSALLSNVSMDWLSKERHPEDKDPLVAFLNTSRIIAIFWEEPTQINRLLATRPVFLSSDHNDYAGLTSKGRTYLQNGLELSKNIHIIEDGPGEGPLKIHIQASDTRSAHRKLAKTRDIVAREVDKREDEPLDGVMDDLLDSIPYIIRIETLRPFPEAEGGDVKLWVPVYQRLAPWPEKPSEGLTDEQLILYRGRLALELLGPPLGINELEDWIAPNVGLHDQLLENYEDFNKAALDRWMAARWVQGGPNVMKISKALGASLILTDFPERSDLPQQDLPYPSVLLRIPPGLLPYPLKDGGHEWVTTLSLSSFTDEGERLVSVALRIRGEVDGNMALSLDKPGSMVDPRTPSYSKSEYALGHQTANLIHNFLAWLDMAGEAPQREYPPKKSRSSAKKHGWPTMWLIGGTVKLSQSMMDVAKDYALGVSGKQGAEGWKLRMQHIVRGHWKLQSHGPNRSLRKRVWIEPYMRGPEGKVAWSHMYEAEE